MKSKRILFIFLLLIILLSSCNGQKVKNEIRKNEVYTGIDASYDSLLKNSSGFYEIAQNESFVLFVNSATTEVAVKDKKTGVMWFTNPQNRENDSIANGTNKDLLNSQFSYKYANLQNKSFEINNFDQSIKFGQFSYFPINNGIRINYLVGQKKKIFLTPKVISESRYNLFNKKMSETSRESLKSFYSKISINDKLTDADRAILQKQYPIIKKTDIYILSTGGWSNNANVSDLLLEMVEGYFKEAGYTNKDLDKDNMDSGVELEKNEDFSLKLSIEYTIDKDGLHVCVPKDGMIYDENVMKMYQFSFLPFFGAAKSSEDGYMFIPDGSGAIINLKNKRKPVGDYNKAVYGNNKSLSSEQKEDTGKYPIYLPVYGIKSEKSAFLAVIENSQSEAEIQANISGVSSEYNQVYSIYNLRNTSIQESSFMNIGGATKYQAQALKSDLKITYLFTPGEEASYTGMALRYQKYLADKGELNKVSISDGVLPFSVEVIGAITYAGNVLGFPIKKQMSLTSYNQAAQIIQKLKDKGIDKINLSYSGWSNDGLNNSLTSKIQYINQMGGEKDYKELMNYIKSDEGNISFYPNINFQYISTKKNFDGFSVNNDAARNVAEMVAYDYDYNIATEYIIKENKRIIISPLAINKYIDSFLKSYGKYKEKGIGLSNFGTDLNGDYRGEGKNTDRQAAMNIMTEQLQKISKSYKVMVSGANSYTLAYASLVRDIPLKSSEHFLFDQSVPFYAIVLHGYIPYATEPLNTSANLENDTLNAIEAGAIPNFKFSYEDSYLLKQTDYPFFSVNFSQWKDVAVSSYEKCNRALASCQTATIKSHQIIKKGVVKVEYSTNIIIYINYNEKSERIDGIDIEPKNYKIVKGVA